MCGIVGFISRVDSRRDSKPVYRAIKTLSHRGPDAQRVWGYNPGRGGSVNPVNDQLFQVVFGHCRLAIIDLSIESIQPMESDSGNVVCFNGEIYNYIELRADLISAGYSFKTNSDTEVILKAYECWGEKCVRRFNGMWSFTLFDQANNKVFMSRDRLGIKPFYYNYSREGFYFASEIGALASLAEKNLEFHQENLARYLIWGKINDQTETIYRDVNELQPAENAVIDLDSLSFEKYKYWKLNSEINNDITDDEALERFEYHFEESVRLRLRSDVPVALTLSGGCDSSAVALATSRVSDSPIQTFTSNFPDNPDIDETEYAQYVANQCGLKSQLVIPSFDKLTEDVPKMLKHQAEPCGSLSLYVHWCILTEIKKSGTKVILSGQGGDELFIGYERYYVSYMKSLFPNFAKMLVAAYNSAKNSRLSLLNLVGYYVYFNNPSLFKYRRKRRIDRVYERSLLNSLLCSEDIIFSELQQLQEAELCGAQIGRLLRYDDRNTSAHGLETRVPFLDYRLVEFGYSLPWKFKLRDGWTKWLIRKYLESHGLAKIAWRKDKLGFNAPTQKWLQQIVSKVDGAGKAAGSVIASEVTGTVAFDTYNISVLEKLNVGER